MYVRQTDTAGNVSAASAAFSFVRDTVAPTIALTSNVSSLRAGQTATVTFTLSEAATGYDINDIVVSGGTLSNFSGSGTTYTATFTPTASVRQRVTSVWPVVVSPMPRAMPIPMVPTATMH